MKADTGSLNQPREVQHSTVWQLEHALRTDVAAR